MIRQRDSKDNLKKKLIASEGKSTTLYVYYTFLYISLPFLYNYDVELPSSTFYGGHKQATTKFYLSFWIWVGILEIQIGGRGGGGGVGFDHD